MSDDKLLISPYGAGHMEDLDKPSGNEYIAWSTSILADPDFFLSNHAAATANFLYNQLEYSAEYGRCLCTMYGPIVVHARSWNIDLTPEQRLELVKLRVAERDFQKDVGWFITVWVDVIRRWWNKNNPDNQVVTFMIQNDSAIRRKFFDKAIPLVRGMKWNRAYTIDTVDGVINSLNYPLNKWETYYGHCTGIQQLEVLDNYLRKYKYKSVEDYYLMRKKNIEGGSSFAIFFYNQLSEKGKAWVKMMRAGVTNGERPDDNTLRQEMAAMVLRLNPTAPSFWNTKMGTYNVTRSEFVSMWERGLGRKCPIQVYTEKTKDAPITRGEAWMILASW